MRLAIKGDQWYYPATKKKFLAIARRELDKSGQIYLRVSYGTGLYNHGTVNNYREAKKFVDECSEKELIKYLGGQSD